jgi:hypothetical protein
MFDDTSRYARVETARLTEPDGREVAYKRRRFLPQGRSLQLLVEVTVAQEDRLDLIAAKILGSPEHFWLVCDANDAMNPIDLTAEPGVRLRVPVPPA